MRRATNLLAWGALVVVGALVGLNWSTLTLPAPLNLGVTQIQAPLGLVVLGVAVVLVALFLAAYLQNLIGSLLESRGLLREVQRIQGLADKAEASRVESLHQLMRTEFRSLHERIDALAPVGSRVARHADEHPVPTGVVSPPA